MKIQEIFENEKLGLKSSQIFALKNQCSDFLSLTKKPLIKVFPQKTETFAKIKVRFHKRKNHIVEIFNQSLQKKFNIYNLHQRAVFAYGLNSSNLPANSYYVFPINRFKFLYSNQIKNLDNQYNCVFETLLDNLEGNEQQVITILEDLLSYNYISTNLEEGIDQGCEIVLFNIPYYFVVKTSVFPDYQQLIKLLED